MKFHASSKWFIALVTILLIASFLLVGCAKTPEPAPAAPTGTVTISPTEATISKAFGLTISGSGFQPNERVSLKVLQAVEGQNLGLALGTGPEIYAISDASGNFQTETFGKMRVPPVTPAGTYTLQALGETSGTVATTTINIVAAAK
ncbi:hypothetical protein ACFLWN_04905 [Chloroflexota bacterium]